MIIGSELADKIREFKIQLANHYPTKYVQLYWDFGPSIHGALSKGETIEHVIETMKEWVD